MKHCNLPKQAMTTLKYSANRRKKAIMCTACCKNVFFMDDFKQNFAILQK